MVCLIESDTYVLGHSTVCEEQGREGRGPTTCQDKSTGNPFKVND